MKLSFLRILQTSTAAVALFSATACQQQRVTLTPSENDLVVLNGCVVSACNYLSVVKAQHSLEKNFWAKILLVKFDNHPAGHAYCVWETEGNVYGYDRNSGAFPLPVYTRDARAIAIVLAQELGKVLKEPMSVSGANFIDSQEAEIYRYGSLQLPQPEGSLATSFQLASITRP